MRAVQSPSFCCDCRADRFVNSSGASAGIAVWRVDVDKDNKSSNAATTSSSSTSASSSLLQYIPGTAGVVKSDPSDPSDFEKNDAYAVFILPLVCRSADWCGRYRFHVSFYGFAYTPFNVQTPECGGVQVNVTEDIQLLSQLTSTCRFFWISRRFLFLTPVYNPSSTTYVRVFVQSKSDDFASDQRHESQQSGFFCGFFFRHYSPLTLICNPVTVWLGAYVGTNETVNAQQLAETIEAIQIYGTDNVGGVIIGNGRFPISSQKRQDDFTDPNSFCRIYP